MTRHDKQNNLHSASVLATLQVNGNTRERRIKLTIEEYYGKHYIPLKTAEEKLKMHIHHCLDSACISDRHIVKYISSRIKTPESVEAKLQRKGFPEGVESAIENLYDVVGIRIVVRFIGEIYTVRDILRETKGIKIIEEKDYIANAKQSGYRSYHMITETEIDGTKIRGEIQLRTMAMDCWASLEHQIRYKKDIDNADLINLELKKCSENLLSADATMEAIRNLVQKDKLNS